MAYSLHRSPPRLPPATRPPATRRNQSASPPTHLDLVENLLLQRDEVRPRVHVHRQPHQPRRGLLHHHSQRLRRPERHGAAAATDKDKLGPFVPLVSARTVFCRCAKARNVERGGVFAYRAGVC